MLRRGTAVEWEKCNPILFDGEICADLTNLKWKIGDGVTDWNSLKFSEKLFFYSIFFKSGKFFINAEKAAKYNPYDGGDVKEGFFKRIFKKRK
jgi:hypothetical protein